jgi:hypothetical protein
MQLPILAGGFDSAKAAGILALGALGVLVALRRGFGSVNVTVGS